MVANEGQDSKIGFCREELGSLSLAGTAKATFSRHIFAAWGLAEEWPAEVPDGFPDGSFPKLIESAVKSAGFVSGEKTKLTFIEASGSIKNGDVLVFPDYIKIAANNESGMTKVSNLLSRKFGTEGCALTDCEDLAGGFLFVCSHTKRDERCGYCGPRLTEAFSKEAQSNGQTVLKCSHVGGHVYAGNVIAYTGKETPVSDDGHWYGYVTPAEAAFVASGKAAKSRLWRGSLGLDEAGARRARLVKRVQDAAPCLLLATSLAAMVAITLRRRHNK